MMKRTLGQLDGKTTLWAWRFSVARGWNWTQERVCCTDDADCWLLLFQRDEPDVAFQLSDNKPRKPAKPVRWVPNDA